MVYGSCVLHDLDRQANHRPACRNDIVVPPSFHKHAEYKYNINVSVGTHTYYIVCIKKVCSLKKPTYRSKILKPTNCKQTFFRPLVYKIGHILQTDLDKNLFTVKKVFFPFKIMGLRYDIMTGMAFPENVIY